MPDLDLTDPLALLLASHDALAAAGVVAATYGGLALAVYGVPRETRDADLAIAGSALTLAVDAFRAAGLNVNPAFANVRFGGNLVSRLAVTGGGELNTVDLVTPRSERLANLVLDRALVGSLRGRELRVVSPEDFVLLKLLSTRARDLEDARTVTEALVADLDRDLIDREVALLRDETPDFDVGARAAAIFGG